MPIPFRDGPYLFMIDKIGALGTNDIPVFAFGPVIPTSTEDRDPTVDPLSGFPCTGTPLGRGHLIALFLGGPDIPQNYAPQYEQWQQGGAWKQMETSIEALGKQAVQSGSRLYMAVSITYDHTDNNYAAALAAFQLGSLQPWTDFRIPSRFKVGTFLSNAQGAAEIVGAMNNDATAAKAILPLLSKPFVTLQGNFGHSTMPDLDYNYWYRNLIRRWATEAFEKAKAEFMVQKEVETAKLSKPAIPIQKTIIKPSQKKKLMAIQPPVLNRREVTRKAEKYAALLTGFEDNTTTLSGRVWKFANGAKIAEYIRGHLAAVGNIYGIRDADLTRLNDPVTGPPVVSAAIV